MRGRVSLSLSVRECACVLERERARERERRKGGCSEAAVQHEPEPASASDRAQREQGEVFPTLVQRWILFFLSGPHLAVSQEAAFTQVSACHGRGRLTHRWRRAKSSAQWGVGLTELRKCGWFRTTDTPKMLFAIPHTRTHTCVAC